MPGENMKRDIELLTVAGAAAALTARGHVQTFARTGSANEMGEAREVGAEPMLSPRVTRRRVGPPKNCKCGLAPLRRGFSLGGEQTGAYQHGLRRIVAAFAL